MTLLLTLGVITPLPRDSVCASGIFGYANSIPWCSFCRNAHSSTRSTSRHEKVFWSRAGHKPIRHVL